MMVFEIERNKMQCKKCQLHAALHGETVCEICFWKYGKYPSYKKAMEAVAHVYCTTCVGYYDRTSEFYKKMVTKIGHYAKTPCVFIYEGWSMLPKMSPVGRLIAVMKSTDLNATPKTTAKTTDYFSKYWLDKFELPY